jgi:glucosamine--fructose-6-phosphate aminotransferase (isomerizing)
LEALKEAKKINNTINSLCITNSPESSLTRLSDLTFSNSCWPRNWSCQYKSFYNSVGFSGITCLLDRQIKNNISKQQETDIVKGLKRLPGLINEALLQEPEIKKLSKRFKIKVVPYFWGEELCMQLPWKEP